MRADIHIPTILLPVLLWSQFAYKTTMHEWWLDEYMRSSAMYWAKSEWK